MRSSTIEDMKVTKVLASSRISEGIWSQPSVEKSRSLKIPIYMR
jgi:hypothetical protein